MKDRIIFHIDVNNAFLSWTAVELLKNGYPVDIRTIPSVIGGDEEKRTGVVTAKSPVAKKMGVLSAEPIYMAKKKCPNLKVFHGDMELYQKRSDELYHLFLEYTPDVERFSVDECFLEMTGTKFLYNDYLKLANEIKDRVFNTFGYTVNVGIGNNKLCAKMASDFEKPNKVHTLFMDEVKNKMWPLPVSELFMVGKKSVVILNEIGIKTIGDLANCKTELLRKYFKERTEHMIEFANGIDNSPVINSYDDSKCISTTHTFEKDVEEINGLKKTLLYQSDIVGFQLRKQKKYANTIAIIYKTKDFICYSKQKKLDSPINVTEDIYSNIISLLRNSWRGEPLRLIGIRLADFVDDKIDQISLFDNSVKTNKDNEKIQEVVDNIKDKFGNYAIFPASLKEK
ncbi:MAG: DNA polymerase IV [Bacilli bacterium]|nr:DNA polymerase IV [Bacilli bacterium]